MKEAETFLTLKQLTVCWGIQTLNNYKQNMEGAYTGEASLSQRGFTVILRITGRQGKPMREIQKHLRKGKAEGKKITAFDLKKITYSQHTVIQDFRCFQKVTNFIFTSLSIYLNLKLIQKAENEASENTS